MVKKKVTRKATAKSRPKSRITAVRERAQPKAPAKPYRIIATEEAWAIPEQLAAMKGVADSATAYDPDLFLVGLQHTDPLHRRLLDSEGERLGIMDQGDVSMHLLAMTSTGVQTLETERAVAIAALGNDRLVEVIRRHPTRYAGLATVAPQDPARAVKEIERAINKLKLNGVMINSHTNGEYLNERKYWPILEAAAALKVPIYIHPRAPSPAMARPYREYHVEHAIWGYQAETGLHGLKLMLSGVFDEFPDLKIVLGHMGEGIPYWFYRIDWMHGRFNMERPRLKLKPSEYFKRNFMITTSGVNWLPALKFCIEVLSADNIMFAVDYPYQETMEAVGWLRDAPISDVDKAKIFHKNAERVFRIPPGA
jgi:predicted TIM-barrel fold metal-dependent hydrolase